MLDSRCAALERKRRELVPRILESEWQHCIQTVYIVGSNLGAQQSPDDLQGKFQQIRDLKLRERT